MVRMKTCETCRFRSISLTGNKTWKCKQFGTVKRFNIAWLHGWLCKHYFNEIIEQKVKEKDKWQN